MTPRQAKFAAEYVKDFNQTQAAIRAGYSARTAPQTASRLLKAAGVKQYFVDHPDSNHVSTQRIVSEYARLAFLDPGEFQRPDGTMKTIAEMSADARRALTGIEHDDDGQLRKLRFASKINALDSLARIHGLMNDPAGAQGSSFAIQINLNVGSETDVVDVTSGEEK